MLPCNPHYHADPGFRVLYIFGAGGSGRELAWLADQCWGPAVEKVFVVDEPRYLTGPVAGIDVRLLEECQAADARYVVAIGDPAQRRRAALRCRDAGLAPATLVHPRAEISQWVRIGEGAVVCAGVVATTDIVIGPHVHINVGCTLGHDVQIGGGSTLSPGVHIAGNVHVGEDVFIGIGACAINGTRARPLVIGDRAVVAAGACVTREVPADAMVAGVPAVRKR